LNAKTESIHRWDGSALLKASLIGASIEAVLIAPALLSPWGHAGPGGLLGWLSVFANLPGGYLFGVISGLIGYKAVDSLVVPVTGVYIIQTFLIAYPTFVWLRWKKRRSVSKTS
jgi:hypothetical protein